MWCVICCGCGSGLPETPPSSVRSQRDRSGEKELRKKQLEDYQAQLDKLDAAIAVAENDKKQFDQAVKRSQERTSELRYSELSPSLFRIL